MDYVLTTQDLYSLEHSAKSMHLIKRIFSNFIKKFQLSIHSWASWVCVFDRRAVDPVLPETADDCLPLSSATAVAVLCP